jgi:hypothetical protein
MSDDYKSSASTAKLGGGKRKNGHKANCSCHICENMKNKAKRGGYEEDAEKEQIKLMGGSKKKNGHKPNCDCPICKNMKNAKKGGDEKPYDDDDSKNDLAITGGKKSNGHKATCGCPICKNMKKKGKKGGENPDIENQLGDIEEGFVKGVNVPDKKAVDNYPPAKKGVETVASNNEYDELDAAERGERGANMVGGTRKRRGNGHKATCKCPICKNMKKKTRRHRKRSHRRR